MKGLLLTSLTCTTLLLFAANAICQSMDHAPKSQPDTIFIHHEKPAPTFLVPNFNYHQTLTMKLFLSQALYDGPLKRKDNGRSDLFLNLEQALDVIQKMDQLTLGIPKIVYLVGWQYNGHDSKYPAWFEGNERLKRKQDTSALQSLSWLMKEAVQYHTTVSLHINMFDAYEDSPLWDLYLQNNIIAKDLQGNPRACEWGYPISYAQEWKTGFAQKRIDSLCKLLPIQQAGTIHIDAFHSWPPVPFRDSTGMLKVNLKMGPISPFLNFTVEDETEAQRNIFRYWKSKGIDVTSEGVDFLRQTSFEGLQPMAWWYTGLSNYLKWPAAYYCGGQDNSVWGQLFGSSIHGEDIVKQDPQHLKGFKEQFCLKTLPWYFLNRQDRMQLIQRNGFKKVNFSNGISSYFSKDSFAISESSLPLVVNQNILMPVPWLPSKSLIAYSKNGYQNKKWHLPKEFQHIQKFKIQRIDIGGNNLSGLGIIRVNQGVIKLSLLPDEMFLLTVLEEPKPFQPAKEVALEQFARTPSWKENATETLADALAYCKENKCRKLLLPEGRLDLWPSTLSKKELYISNGTEDDAKSKIRYIGMLLQGMENLSIEGKNTLVVLHGKMISFALIASKNITVKNIRFDYHRPTISEMTLLKVGSNKITARIHPDSWFRINAGKIEFYGEGWVMKQNHTVILDTLTNKMRYGKFNVFLKSNAKLVDSLMVEFEGDFSKENLKAGEVVTVRDPYRDNAGAFIEGSKNIHLENLQMQYMHGLGIVSQFSENIELKNIKVAPAARSGRFISSFADCFHFSGCKGKILIDHCFTSGSHDDPINVHGTHLKIVGIEGPSKIRIRFMHHQSYGFKAFQVNDSLSFVDPQTLLPQGYAVVKKAVLINSREMLLELSNASGKGMIAGNCVENITWTPSVSITNCSFERCNTRGILVTTRRKVLIENNQFTRLGMHAILIADDASSWYESGAVTDVTIKGNQFTGCGYNSAPASFQIAIVPENHKKVKGQFVHRNIRIAGNKFELEGELALKARSVDGLEFEGNWIRGAGLGAVNVAESRMTSQE